MVEWAIGVSLAAIFVSVVLILMPDGKVAAFCKPLIGLSVFISAVAPFFGGYDNFVDSEYMGNDGSAFITVDESYLSYINDLRIAEYRDGCVKIAKNLGLNCGEVLIEYNVNDKKELSVTSLNIYLNDSVIILKDEHIDILRRFKEDLSEYLNVDITEIAVYEK